MASTLEEVILTSSPDGTITAYDATSGSTLAHFNGSRSPRKGLALVGKKLIAASHVSSDTGLGSVHLYNWWSPTAYHQLPMPEPVAPLIATQDGLYLFAGGVSGHIHSISLPSGDVIQSFAAHCKAITCLEINGDGSLLLSGSDDGTISVFSVYKLLDPFSFNNSNQLVLQRFEGHESSVTEITTGIGGCNCNIISCSTDCTLKFWSLMYQKALRTITFPCTTWDVAMDPLESEFYIAGSDGLVYKGALKVTSRQRVKHGNELMTWNKKQGRPIIAIATTNWGQNLVTASEDGSVCIWDVERGELIKVLDQQRGDSSISHLLVARGLKDGVPPLVRMRESFAGCGKMELGASVRELDRPITELMEAEQQLAVSMKDRRRAIDNLELAIGAYERLLKLILREAKAGSNSSNVHDDLKEKEKEI